MKVNLKHLGIAGVVSLGILATAGTVLTFASSEKSIQLEATGGNFLDEDTELSDSDGRVNGYYDTDANTTSYSQLYETNNIFTEAVKVTVDTVAMGITGVDIEYTWSGGHKEFLNVKTGQTVQQVIPHNGGTYRIYVKSKGSSGKVRAFISDKS